jgi:hypothetical protein
MITESEQNALQLAKKVFEHFTHDALPIAREIIAMELELAVDHDLQVTIPVTMSPEPNTKPRESIGLPAIEILQAKPLDEMNSIRIAGPLKSERMQAEEQPEKRGFEELPF